MNRKSEIMIYVHIPFCVRKCRYCDFLSFDTQQNSQTYALYEKALEEELAARAEEAKGRIVTSIYFGGGTPSLLPGECIARVLWCIRQSYEIAANAEISLEANPGTIDETKAGLWKEAGVTRISMGVQSFDEGLLKALGRIHGLKEIDESVSMLQQAGFSHLSFDLMFGLPYQTLPLWRQTLQEAVLRGVEHLSCYSLTIEEGTPFSRLYTPGKKPLPDEDTEREMYHEAVDLLARQGLRQYEISNFARTGCESYHNSGYWVRRPYIGTGLGASSLTAGQVRFANTRDMKEYLENAPHPALLRREERKLSLSDQMAEFMFLGLRMNQGVKASEFQKAFGVDLSSQYGTVLAKHMAEGLLEREGDTYRLTSYGRDVSNQVFVDFI